MGLRTVYRLAADERVDLLVVEGDHAGDGQQLPGGEVVRPGQVLVHGAAGLDRPVAAGRPLVRARGHRAGGDQVLEADISPADVVPRRQAGLEHQHRDAESASTKPSSSTRTGRLERSASTRTYGLRGCTNTCSSSSNQASSAPHSKRTVP